VRAILDQVDPKIVFVVTLALLGVGSELGFRLARDGSEHQKNEDKKGQVGALLASMLGLLALLLAFILAIVQDRFVERSELVVEEASAINQTHLRAELLPPARASRVQQLLREYVDLNLSVKKASDLENVERRTEEIQRALWAEATTSAAERPDSLPVSLFVSSINQLIDTGEKRLAAAVYRRLPGKLLLALYVVALLAFFVQGHSGGLAHARVPTAAVVVAFSVAVVLTLIVDIDRPWQGGIRISQQALENVKHALVARR
jgi:hypothetical protein